MERLDYSTTTYSNVCQCVTEPNEARCTHVYKDSNRKHQNVAFGSHKIDRSG